METIGYWGSIQIQLYMYLGELKNQENKWTEQKELKDIQKNNKCM